MFRTRFVLMVALLCGAIALPGCGGASVNKAQYDRLKLGMTATDVDEILGKGKPVEAAEAERLVKESLTASGQAGGAAPKIDIDLTDVRGMRWGSDKKNITVIFKNDRLFRAFQQGL